MSLEEMIEELYCIRCNVLAPGVLYMGLCPDCRRELYPSPLDDELGSGSSLRATTDKEEAHDPTDE